MCFFPGLIFFRFFIQLLKYGPILEKNSIVCKLFQYVNMNVICTCQLFQSFFFKSKNGKLNIYSFINMFNSFDNFVFLARFKSFGMSFLQN